MAPVEVGRGKARALLVGVDTYERRPDGFRSIGAGKATRNLEAVRAALSHWVTGIMPSGQVGLLINPELGGEVHQRIKAEGAKAPALLVVYYMGHGYIPPGTDDLYLTVSGSGRAAIESTGIHLKHLVDWIALSDCERFVLILDCCFSGDMAQQYLPGSKPASFLTSSPRRMLISTGPEGEVTPYTQALVKVLTEGAAGDGPVTVTGLGSRLDQLAEDQSDVDFKWFSQQVSSMDGADTVLSLVRLDTPFTRRQRLLRGARSLGSALVSALWRWGMGRGRPLWRRFVWLGVALALVVPLGYGGAVLARSDPAGPCPAPLELRLVTSPEEVDALKDLAGVYENSAFGGGCHKSHLGVYGAGLDTLFDAFENYRQWGRGGGGLLRQAGPQPDMWLAQSSAEVDYVRATSADLATGVSVAQDDPVVVLTEQGRETLGLPVPKGKFGETDWNRLRAAIKKAKGTPRLLRPNPAVSGTGLVHLLGMDRVYREGSGDDLPYDSSTPLLGRRERGTLESQVIGRGEPVADGADAVCGLRSRHPADEDGAVVGALTTLRQATRASCPQATAPTLLRTYVIKGVPPLDYPLVNIALSSQTPARAAEMARFREWLSGTAGADALSELGFTAAGATTVALPYSLLVPQLDVVKEAHRDLRVTVLFDVSASMREGGKFDAARTAVTKSLLRLGEDARYETQIFPRDKGGGGSLLRGAPWKERTAAASPPISVGDISKERQADLYDALRSAGNRITDDMDASYEGDSAPQHVILLVTDGDYVKGKTPRIGALRKEARALGAKGVQIHVAAMRPEGCASAGAAQGEAAVLADESGGSCSRLSGSLDSQLARQMAGLAEGERR
ncbi:substrate-binding domain-containing protein [Streptomyces tsukubensis]|uniref:VWFA domain-containing protein n=1 Tax=Streptomyces tsukubensis TaxID=83656 RepID=A0A1V4ABR7_9ACTN|nr:substrate-binding domain-containing protein [Streptomyces tsukubensis]OON80821.1 hypothetical protein B1H18_10520 [Streptomyces tsukubensis]QFR93539.1 hypothetical protein GBW32_11145 [Streptomyces tsukubensis]